jgi:AcrR family transcriptional regulator
MGSSTPASTRERLLDAAATLFYRDGIGVGVEALCKAAGVSKRSMYQLFDSKDALVAASLEYRAPVYAALTLPGPDDTQPSRERIMHVFERLEAVSGTPEYRGCPFVATAVELKDPEHPASVVARHAKDGLTAFFRAEAERGGAGDPETLARELTVVFDGASARAVVQGGSLDGLAVKMAATLLDAAGLCGRGNDEGARSPGEENRAP